MVNLSFEKPLLMGILNITPDSFSDGGKYFGFETGEDDENGEDVQNGEDVHPRLQEDIMAMILNGADIIDIGAESTFGPDAQVSAEEEWRRLEPVLRFIQQNGEDIHPRLQAGITKMILDGADIIDIGAESTFGPRSQVTADEEWNRLEPVLQSIQPIPEGEDGYPRPPKPIFISVDTWKADVGERALALGVQMINDVTALRCDPRMIDVLLKYQPYVCLMYSAYDTPYAGRENKQYEDVIATIKEFLQERTKELMKRGFPEEKIIIDPGLGFFLSSDPSVSWEVIDRLDELKSLGFPILIGPSMKSFLGGEIKDRLPKSLEAAKKCLERGANILRVHHVKEHKDLYNHLAP